MIRLKSIKIEGFKSPKMTKYFEFSDEPITVMFGENGSGKTTFLKILFAVLAQDETVLIDENVHKVVIKYVINQEEEELVVEHKEGDYTWGKAALLESTSVMFGVHRGIVRSVNERKTDLRELFRNIYKWISRFKHLVDTPKFKQLFYMVTNLLDEFLEKKQNEYNIEIERLYFLLDEFLNYLNTHARGKRYIVEHAKLSALKNKLQYYIYQQKESQEDSSFVSQPTKSQHFSVDFVQIKDIKQAIINQFDAGQKVVATSIKAAFLDTLSKAIEIDETQEDYILPDDFYERVTNNRNFLLKAVEQENSKLATRIRDYVKTGSSDLTANRKIFRAMLLDMVKGAEEPNPALDSINTLTTIFNEHLYGDKQLIISKDTAYIDLGEYGTHGLNKLSSGERNLLSILTLFLIIGNGRDFLIIDEPEISLNLKWQRKFLPMLSKINKDAQIIVASHSPAIAHANSNYLKELV